MSVSMRTYPSREEWLKARNSRIGGSDAGAIMGLNPYMSNVDLWEIKTGKKKKPDLSDNKFVQFGHDAEPLMRELFKLDFPEIKVHYMDNNMWVNDEYPFAHASLDGWLTCEEGNGILEIKTVNIMNGQQLRQWNKRIPDIYYCQIRHYSIERKNCEGDIEALADAERKFMWNIDNGVKPDLILPQI